MECFKSNWSQYWLQIKGFHKIIKISVSFEKSENIATLASSAHLGPLSDSRSPLEGDEFADSPAAHS